MIQLIEFAVSALVLFSGHIAFWFIFTKLFSISTGIKMIAAIVILFMFFSVVLSSYLIHKKDNVFTRNYYLISCFWVGLLVNFCLMALLILILKSIGWTFGFIVPLLLVKLIFFGGAFIFSFWGVYNAWFPGIITYEVKIKDLPDSWNNKTVVQISDVHLGPVHREKFFGRLLSRVQALNPEAVFITGDLFDGMESDFVWLKHPFEKMRVPKGIYYSFGNHDLYLGFDRVIDILKDNPVTILDNKMVIVDGLQIIGINYSFNKDFDLQEAILKQVGYDKKLPSILLFHEPKNVELAKNAEIDLQLSGHTHNGQLFPFNYISKLAYSGYGYGLFNDQDFSLIVSRGSGTWGPPMRTTGRGEIAKIILKKK
jgi:predicted MPP superfamily phosphohydrolase